MNKRLEFNQIRWHDMTLPQQLGNVGSDFERALKWKQKGKQELFANAAKRTIEQLDMTVSSRSLYGIRRREITRLREETKKELYSKKINIHATDGLANYFLKMALLARKQMT